MRKYASQTSVSPDRSRAEIEKILARYGASGFMYGWNEMGAVIGFMLRNKQYRFTLTLPSQSDYRTSPAGRRWSHTQANKALDQAVRQRWRALALVIKAKLEAVSSDISTVEKEFFAWMVLPNGQTAGDTILPQIEEAYETGRMPKLLPLIEGDIHD